MSGKIIKTIISPAIFVLITVLTMFSVSANTTDEITTSIDNASNINEQEFDNKKNEGLPTMKASYIIAPGQVYDDGETEATTVESTVEGSKPTQATGATSFISSIDNPATASEASMDTATSGVVKTSDTSMSVVILVGLIALCCVIIGMHKKNLTE